MHGAQFATWLYHAGLNTAFHVNGSKGTIDVVPLTPAATHAHNRRHRHVQHGSTTVVPLGAAAQAGEHAAAAAGPELPPVYDEPCAELRGPDGNLVCAQFVGGSQQWIACIQQPNDNPVQHADRTQEDEQAGATQCALIVFHIKSGNITEQRDLPPQSGNGCRAWVTNSHRGIVVYEHSGGQLSIAAAFDSSMPAVDLLTNLPGYPSRGLEATRVHIQGKHVMVANHQGGVSLHDVSKYRTRNSAAVSTMFQLDPGDVEVARARSTLQMQQLYFSTHTTTSADQITAMTNAALEAYEEAAVAAMVYNAMAKEVVVMRCTSSRHCRNWWAILEGYSIGTNGTLKWVAALDPAQRCLKPSMELVMQPCMLDLGPDVVLRYPVLKPDGRGLVLQAAVACDTQHARVAFDEAIHFADGSSLGPAAADVVVQIRSSTPAAHPVPLHTPDPGGAVDAAAVAAPATQAGADEWKEGDTCEEKGEDGGEAVQHDHTHLLSRASSFSAAAAASFAAAAHKGSELFNTANACWVTIKLACPAAFDAGVQYDHGNVAVTRGPWTACADGLLQTPDHTAVALAHGSITILNGKEHQPKHELHASAAERCASIRHVLHANKHTLVARSGTAIMTSTTGKPHLYAIVEPAAQATSTTVVAAQVIRGQLGHTVCLVKHKELPGWELQLWDTVGLVHRDPASKANCSVVALGVHCANDLHPPVMLIAAQDGGARVKAVLIGRSSVQCVAYTVRAGSELITTMERQWEWTFPPPDSFYPEPTTGHVLPARQLANDENCTDAGHVMLWRGRDVWVVDATTGTCVNTDGEPLHLPAQPGRVAVSGAGTAVIGLGIVRVVGTELSLQPVFGVDGLPDSVDVEEVWHAVTFKDSPVVAIVSASGSMYGVADVQHLLQYQEVPWHLGEAGDHALHACNSNEAHVVDADFITPDIVAVLLGSGRFQLWNFKAAAGRTEGNVTSAAAFPGATAATLAVMGGVDTLMIQQAHSVKFLALDGLISAVQETHEERSQRKRKRLHISKLLKPGDDDISTFIIQHLELSHMLHAAVTTDGHATRVTAVSKFGEVMVQSAHARFKSVLVRTKVVHHKRQRWIDTFLNGTLPWILFLVELAMLLVNAVQMVMFGVQTATPRSNSDAQVLLNSIQSLGFDSSLASYTTTFVGALIVIGLLLILFGIQEFLERAAFRAPKSKVALVWKAAPPLARVLAVSGFIPVFKILLGSLDCETVDNSLVWPAALSPTGQDVLCFGTVHAPFVAAALPLMAAYAYCAFRLLNVRGELSGVEVTWPNVFDMSHDEAGPPVRQHALVRVDARYWQYSVLLKVLLTVVTSLWTRREVFVACVVLGLALVSLWLAARFPPYSSNVFNRLVVGFECGATWMGLCGVVATVMAEAGTTEHLALTVLPPITVAWVIIGIVAWSPLYHASHTVAGVKAVPVNGVGQEQVLLYSPEIAAGGKLALCPCGCGTLGTACFCYQEEKSKGNADEQDVSPWLHSCQYNKLESVGLAMLTTPLLRDMHTVVDGLVAAAAAGNTELANFIADQPGVDINWSNATELTAVAAAAAAGHHVCMTSLLKRYDVNKVRQRRLALFAAAQNGRVKCLRPLLQAVKRAGSVRDKDGMTALMLAARGGHLACVQMLLARGGVDVGAVHARSGLTAAGLASIGDGSIMWQQLGEACVSTLIRAGGCVSKPLPEHCQKRLVNAMSHMGENTTQDTSQVESSAIRTFGCCIASSKDWWQDVWLEAARSAGACNGAVLLPLAEAAVRGRQFVGDDMEERFKARCCSEYWAGYNRLMDQEDDHGMTPLMRATRNDRGACVNALLAVSEGDINAVDEAGDTALIWAAREGNLDILNTLLKQPGINVNAVNKDKYTALIWAARAGHTECLLRLVKEKGVDVNARNKMGNTALILAARQNNFKCLSALLNLPGVDVNVINTDRNTALIWAARSGNVECLDALLATEFVDVNLVGSYDYTALIWAARNDSPGCVASLLAVPGIDVTVTGKKANNALLMAAKKGNTECLKLLLAVPGINVNCVDLNGNTPLIAAAEHSHGECMKALLEHPDCSVNTVGKEEYTALIWAASTNTCVRELLAQRHIQVDAVSKQGFTALMMAAKHGHLDALLALLARPGNALLRKSSNGDTALSLAAKHGHLPCVEAILAKTLDLVNTTTKNGSTPLILAVENGHVDILKRLLRVPSVEVNHTNRSRSTALARASDMNRPECVAALLAVPGIDVNMVDKAGYTAVMWASLKGATEVVRMLLAVPGINLAVTNKKRKDAVMLAKGRGHLDIVELLTAALAQSKPCRLPDTKSVPGQALRARGKAATTAAAGAGAGAGAGAR